MQRYGITIPFDGIPLADQRDLVAQLPDLGYTDVWSSEVDGADAFTPLVLASVGGPARRRSPRGPGPACGRRPWGWAPPSPRCSPAARPPWPSARPAWPRPPRAGVAIGIGASSDVIVERWNGLAFDR